MLGNSVGMLVCVKMKKIEFRGKRSHFHKCLLRGHSAAVTQERGEPPLFVFLPSRVPNSGHLECKQAVTLPVSIWRLLHVLTRFADCLLHVQSFVTALCGSSSETGKK